MRKIFYGPRDALRIERGDIFDRRHHAAKCPIEEMCLALLAEEGEISGIKLLRHVDGNSGHRS